MKHMRTLFFTLLLLIPGPVLAQTADAYGTVWKPLAIGAGGWLVGMDIARDGTKVVRTDTYGAYLWTGSQWAQLVNATSMPAGDVNVDNQEGVYEIRIAPSNTSRFYMMYMGAVYRTNDKGSTWTKTTFTPVTGADPNDNYRMNGEKMAVDPINPNVVYVGTGSNGLWVSPDAGTSWTRVSGVPAGIGGGITGIAFDPTSGQTGGKTNTIYAGSWLSGVYRSTDAGVTWTKPSGGPTTVHHGLVGSDGIYYATDGAAAYKFAGGVWTTINTSSGWHSVAVDPSNPARIILGDDGGTLIQSLDRGATWGQGILWGSSTYPISRVATDIPWLDWTNESYMSSGNMTFDPSASNKLYFSEGIGVWYTSIATNQLWDVGPIWTSQSLGIEQLVANKVISPPGGKPVLASWDRPVFYINDPDVYPTSHGPDNKNALVMGWGLDYASSNPSFVAAVMNWSVEKSGYSSDGGQTWHPFATYPPFLSAGKIGGDIAASTPLNMVWAPGTNGVPHYTSDGGSTWHQGIFPGAATSGQTGWGFASYLDRQIVAADRVNFGTFYAYNYLKGLYRSTDGGVTWTLIKSGEIVPFSSYNTKLKAVPGNAGHLFYTNGQSGVRGDPNPDTSDTFVRSTDGGVTWTAIPNVAEVYDFGFGAPATTGGYPAIFIAGWVNKQYGIWRSDNQGTNWTQVGKWPLNSLDAVKTISGDMNQYGRIYVGFGGSGYAYGNDGATAIQPAPAPAPTASLVANPTSIAAGQSSTLSWSSANATSCSGAGFSTGNASSGSVAVAAANTTAYSVTCTGLGGSASASATIAVASAPTAFLTANPNSITAGQPSTLSWSSANASSCSGAGFSTGNAISGSVAVAPASSTTYSVTCTGLGGSASGSATLTVSIPINSFQVGASVQTTASFNVRSRPTLTSKILCTQPAGSSGTITGGPGNGSGYTWWYVVYKKGCSGWTVQNHLAGVTS
jgi:hypothetical protein